MAQTLPPSPAPSLSHERPDIKIFSLPNGAQLAYIILGSEHLKDTSKTPLLIINGMSMRFEDWDVISRPLSNNRTSEFFPRQASSSKAIHRVR